MASETSLVLGTMTFGWASSSKSVTDVSSSSPTSTHPRPPPRPAKDLERNANLVALRRTMQSSSSTTSQAKGSTRSIPRGCTQTGAPKRCLDAF